MIRVFAQQKCNKMEKPDKPLWTSLMRLQSSRNSGTIQRQNHAVRRIAKTLGIKLTGTMKGVDGSPSANDILVAQQGNRTVCGGNCSPLQPSEDPLGTWEGLEDLLEQFCHSWAGLANDTLLKLQ